MDLQKQLFENLRRLLPKGKTLVVAVSGGSDSVALLRLLGDSERKEKNIVVAHLDHALRETSAQDALFVQDLCQKLAIPVYTERMDVAHIAKEKKWNLEDAARRLRYSFLAKISKEVKADAILTAHTLDDQAETVLMQLLRRSAFLAGIQEKQNKIIRPLLNVSRKDLQDYLASIKQDYRTDESNFDISKTRAWLRHDILPTIEPRYPNIKLTLAKLAHLQQAQKVHFDQLAKTFLNSQNEIEIKPLLKQDTALQRHIIASLEAYLEFKHIETLREHLESNIPIRIALPENKLARIAYGKLNILKPEHQDKSKLLIPFERLDKNWKAIIEQSVDIAKLEDFNNLVLRHRKVGDTIKLAGGTKKVSNLLIDLKVPKEERDSIVLLASDKNVLWIKDVATDSRVSRKLENTDITYMKRVLLLAERAIAQGDLPVGCVIVKNGQIIAEAFNQTEANKSPFAHAEVLAMQQATKHLGDWRLEDCTLYVTLEPCPMCFGAILQAHVSKVVYAATNTRDGALGSVMSMQNAPWKRNVEIHGGLLEKEASQLLSHFFAKRRTQSS